MSKYDCEPTLTDREVMDFCRNGYLVLPAVVDDEVNRRTVEFMAEPEHARAMEPVDILEQDWFDQGVIKNPAAAGAVRSLLGRDFLLPNMISSHRTVGPTPPQNWHPDAGSIITHRLDYLQVFYYPSGATKEMGPTEIVPGTHLSPARSAMLGRIKSLKHSRLTVAPPGTIFLTIYSVLHRRSNSTYPGIRDNLKYNYWRTTEPRRDWVVEPDVNLSWLSNMNSPLFGPEQGKMFAWLCGEDWEFAGGQSWPCFSATVHEVDQMGIPAGLRRHG